VILDSSAIVAIVLGEDEADDFLRLIESSETVGTSSATFVEAGIVLSHRFGKPMQDDLEFLFMKLGVSVLPFTDEHRREALDAWWRFGKSRHAAGLNFGDCIAYATAKLSDEPLLFKGDDFRRTDIGVAL
jgi:ribonuclease VapC